MRKNKVSNFLKSLISQTMVIFTKDNLIVKYCISIVFVILLTQCAKPEKKIFKADLTAEDNEITWAIKDINPDLPSNWENYRFLLVEMRISTPQYFWFGFKTGNNHYTNRITTFPNTWIKMSIPLDYYRSAQLDGDEMASLWGKPRITGKMSTYGDVHGKLNEVDSIKIKMANTLLKDQTFEIRSLTLMHKDGGEKIIEPKILIDEFGQWNNEEWEGKIHSTKELKNSWVINDSLTFSTTTDRDIYGGFPDTNQGATGFFRIEQIGGKWWMIDPIGNLFLGTGVNGVRYAKYEYTPTHGREYIFKELPPKEFSRPSYWKYSEPDVSFTQWNLFRRYGDNWKQNWTNFTAKRMHAWGLNMTNWSDVSLNDKIVYTKFLWGWGVQGAPLGIPDVYSPKLEPLLDSLANVQCTPLKNDPWMLGYFTGNEPIWPGRESLAVEAILKGKDTDTKKALQDYLAKGDSPERKKEFIVNAYTKYLKMVKASIKKYDSNHLILGTRLGGEPSDEALKLAQIFDVVSLNIYSNEIPKDFLNKIYKLSERPIFIGEFHMGVPGRGLAPGLIQVADEEQKAIGYQHYVENAFSHPAVIATTWYKWRDEMPTGHEFGSNYNIGIIDVTDNAYPKLVARIIKTHNRLLKLHSGKLEPSKQIAKGGKDKNYVE